MSEIEFSGLSTSVDLIRPDLICGSATEVVVLLAEAAIDAGLATSDYLDAVIARESEYPTGLPTAVPVAIPHIHNGCLRSFLACATLREPVLFASMDRGEKPLPVSIVLMFGITDPAAQSTVLRQLSTLLQDEPALEEMRSCGSTAALIAILKDHLGPNLIELS
jgi:PTS system galactitol-specific IIA component